MTIALCKCFLPQMIVFTVVIRYTKKDYRIYTRKRAIMKKNYCLNTIKGIVCFFIIFMHIPFPGAFGRTLNHVTGFSVPIFYLISGYYLYRAEASQMLHALPGKIRRIGILCLEAGGLYLLWNIFISYFGNGRMPMAEWFRLHFTGRNLLKFIVMQNTDLIGGRGPLWFLFALFWAYVLIWIILHFKHWRAVAGCMMLLLLLNAVLPAMNFGWDYYHNVWTKALPYIFAGMYIAEKKTYEKPGCKVLLLLFVVFSLVIAVLSNILFALNYSLIQCFTIFSAAVVFLFALKKPDSEIRLFGNIGDKYSLLIYILHPIVITIIQKASEIAGVTGNTVYAWTAPLMTAAVCYAAAMIWIRIKEFIKTKFAQRFQ